MAGTLLSCLLQCVVKIHSSDAGHFMPRRRVPLAPVCAPLRMQLLHFRTIDGCAWQTQELEITFNKVSDQILLN